MPEKKSNLVKMPVKKECILCGNNIVKELDKFSDKDFTKQDNEDDFYICKENQGCTREKE